MSLRSIVASRAPRIATTTTMTARLSARKPFVPATRRNVGGSSTPPHSTKSWDMPWIIGSVVVIVPLAYYLVGRSSLKHGDNISKDAAKVPVSEKGYTGSTSGGASANQIRDNIEKSNSGDTQTGYTPNPIGAIQRSRLKGDTTDNDMDDSIKRSLETDAPKTAYRAEEEKAKMKR